jgi:predicted small secreted protein
LNICVQSKNVFNQENAMKLLVVLVVAAALTGCGTMGGAVSGAGDDLKRAGDWIKSR